MILAYPSAAPCLSSPSRRDTIELFGVAPGADRTFQIIDGETVSSLDDFKDVYVLCK